MFKWDATPGSQDRPWAGRCTWWRAPRPGWCSTQRAPEMMQSLWMTKKLMRQRTMWMMMPTKLTTMEMRTSTSILSSGLCRDFLGGKLDKLRKNCQGHLSRWTANKAKSRSWQMEWVWLVDEHLRVEALWAEARSNAAGGLSCELTWDQSDPCESDVDTGYIRDVKTDVSTSCWNCNYRKKAI